MASDNIQRSLKEEKQGNVAGMYNILVYKQQMLQLDGDGITRNIPPTVSVYNTPRPQSSYENKLKPLLGQNSKRSEPVKSAPSHRNHVVKLKENVEVEIRGEREIQRPSTSSGKRKPELPIGEIRAVSATLGGRPLKSPLVNNPMSSERNKVNCSPRALVSVQSPLRVERPSTPVELVCGNTEPKASVVRKVSEKPRTPRVP